MRKELDVTYPTFSNPEDYPSAIQSLKLYELGFLKGSRWQKYRVITLSVGELLRTLPHSVGSFDLHLSKYQNTDEPVMWQIDYHSINIAGEYVDGLHEVENTKLADAAADMLIWLIENNYYEVSK